MIKKQSRNHLRVIRHLRVRKKVCGTSERPRLNVFRSNAHIYAQIIDDQRGVTLCTASTLSSELKGMAGGNKAAAEAVGRLLGKRAAGMGIGKVVFDRGGYRYHGRVKALAEAARSEGLEF